MPWDTTGLSSSASMCCSEISSEEQEQGGIQGQRSFWDTSVTQAPLGKVQAVRKSQQSQDTSPGREISQPGAHWESLSH